MSKQALKGLSIMIIEDYPDLRKLYAHVLTQAGAECHLFRSAEEALEGFEKLQPDVILSDIVLPEMNGHDFMKTLRSNYSQHMDGVISIAITGFESTSAQALTSGFDAFLVKPFTGEILVEKVSEVLRA